MLTQASWSEARLFGYGRLADAAGWDAGVLVAGGAAHPVLHEVEHETLPPLLRASAMPIRAAEVTSQSDSATQWNLACRVIPSRR